MSQVRVRLKRRITIPATIAHQAGIKPGDLLDLKFTSGLVRLKLANRARHRRALMHFAGIAKGVRVAMLTRSIVISPIVVGHGNSRGASWEAHRSAIPEELVKQDII